MKHEKQIWAIVAKIRAQCPRIFVAATTHDDDGVEDVSGVLYHVRSVWSEGITDDEWFAASVKKLKEQTT